MNNLYIIGLVKVYHLSITQFKTLRLSGLGFLEQKLPSDIRKIVADEPNEEISIVVDHLQ
jgi:hypothetical protein